MIKAYLFAATVSTLTVSAPAASDVPPDSCHVQGERIQWIADYCMLKMQTDDEIAVSDCIAENHEQAFSNECAAKIHYKEAMCGLIASNAGSTAAMESCVLDPDFMGRTVKNGGVGG